jgi:serine/threonine protein kinase
MSKRENPDQDQDTPSKAKRARTSAIDFETEDSKPSASEQVLKSGTNEYLCIGNVSLLLRMQDSRGRRYSVKRINLALASSRKITAAMLEHECDQNESFEHANLVRYFRNFYSLDGAYFHIVNENLESGTLADQVQANPAPTEGRITEWLEQIASALNYLHEMGVLHGDLTPENVLLTASGKIKITTPTVLHAHTKAEALIYTSHERCNGLPFDGRDDMWAVGCILAELLAKTRY